MPLPTEVKTANQPAPSGLARFVSPGGKAAPAPVRAKHYTPCELSTALEAGGLKRTPRWVADECHAGRIATNPAFRGRHYIPESELFRLLGIAEASA